MTSIATTLAVPDLINAALTSRLFQEALRDRVLAAINRCLRASEDRFGPDVMDKIRTFAALCHLGLHPLTLSALPRGEPFKSEVVAEVGRDPNGRVTVAVPDGGTGRPPGLATVKAGWHPPGFFVDVESDDIYLWGGERLNQRPPCPLPCCRGHVRQHPGNAGSPPGGNAGGHAGSDTAGGASEGQPERDCAPALVV